MYIFLPVPEYLYSNYKQKLDGLENLLGHYEKNSSWNFIILLS